MACRVTESGRSSTELLEVFLGEEYYRKWLPRSCWGARKGVLRLSTPSLGAEGVSARTQPLWAVAGVEPSMGLVRAGRCAMYLTTRPGIVPGGPHLSFLCLWTSGTSGPWFPRKPLKEFCLIFNWCFLFFFSAYIASKCMERANHAYFYHCLCQ